MSLLARALHDSNLNRGPQELQFKSGDILRVLHQNVNNLHGWWLCQLKAQTGLVPSNRLQVIGREKIEVFEDDHAYDIPVIAPTSNNAFSQKNNNGFQSNDDKQLATRRSFYENLNSFPSEERLLLHSSTNQNQNFSIAHKNIESNDSNTMLKQKSANLNFSEFDSGYDNVDPRTGLERRHRNNTSPSRKLSVRFKDSSPRNKSNARNQGNNTAPAPDPWSHPVGGNYGDYFNMRETEYVNSHSNNLITKRSSSSDSNSVNSKSPSSSKSSSSSASKSDVGVVQISKYAANHYAIESQGVPSSSILASSSSDASQKQNNSRDSDSKSISDEPLLILRNTSLGRGRGVNGSDNRQSNSSNSSIDSREVPIAEAGVLNIPSEEASHALDSLYGNFTQIISKLFRFIHSKWKTEECLSNTHQSISTTCFTLQQNLKEFCQFCHGVLANSQNYADNVMEKSLWKHMAPLHEKSNALHEEIDLCNSVNWSPEELSNFSKDPETDYLCHIINLVRSISIDVRSVHTCIKANVSLLFPINQQRIQSHQSKFETHRSRYDNRLMTSPRPQSPYSPSPDRSSISPHRRASDWRAQSPLTLNVNQRHNSPMKHQNLMEFRSESPSIMNLRDLSPIPQRNTPTRQLLIEDIARPESSCSGNLTPTPHRASERKNLSTLFASGNNSDISTLKLYSAQLESHGELLGSTMEELLKCLAQNQPPNVFVAHSKFLIKSATQIVHLANSLCQGLTENFKNEKLAIEKLANELCGSLKLVIKETKEAAAEYPSLGPIQNLVCAVGKVRENAFHLRRTVRKAATSSV